MKKLLVVMLTLSLMLSSFVPALAAEIVTETVAETSAVDFPLGASNRTINIDGTNYLINDTYTTNGWGGNVRGTIPNYKWDSSFETYTFDPSAIEGITFDSKYGFPLRASYRTPTDYFGEMNYLAQTYPNLVKLSKIGNTVGISDSITGGSNPGADPANSAPLYAMEICNAPGADDGRPAALHMGGNHGGELPSNEMTMNLAWYLLANYGKPGYEDVTNLLDTTKILILPMTNEDGTIASMRATGGRRQNANGVDPNRNWPYGWGSNNGSSASARGVAPASEPEIRAVTDFYLRNQVVTSISGHTSGQIVIYAWGHQTTNGKAGQPLLHKLASEMTALNMHHEQPSEALYPASGDLCDFTWGLARALHFTVEYGTVQAPAYMGQNRYMAYTNYNDANGNTRKIPITYSTNANSRQPATDITAPVAFVDNPKYSVGGYGNIEKTATLAEVQALGDITGKIFVSPQGSSTTETANIIAAAQAQGAVGVIISTAGTSAYGNNNTGGSFYSPGNVNAAITIPVAGTSKPYAREIWTKAKAGENVTVTLKSTQDTNVESQYWQWERHLESYMKNMSFATEYASHIKGSITDGKGNPLPGATLNLSMIADGLVKHSGTYSNYLGYGDNPYPVGTFEAEHTSVYNVAGSDFDWSVVPSQQPDPQLPSEPDDVDAAHVDKPDYAPRDRIKDKDGNLTGDSYTQLPDRGYDITATAGGRYNDTKNVKVGDYKLTIEGINFDLPVAIATDFTFTPEQKITEDITVPFTVYNRDGTPYTGNVTASLNGQLLGIQNSSVKFNLGARGISSIDDAVLVISIDDESASPLVISTGAKAINDDNLILTSDKGAVKAGEEFTMTTAFEETVETNAIILTYKYDSDVFELKGVTGAEGVTILTRDEKDGLLKYTVMAPKYGVTDILNLNFAAKGDQEFNGALKTFSVNAQYVVNTVPKTTKAAVAVATVKTIPDVPTGSYTLIDLSNIIDWYGYDNTRSDWYLNYAEWDFNNDGIIDIFDITYVARLVVFDGGDEPLPFNVKGRVLLPGGAPLANTKFEARIYIKDDSPMRATRSSNGPDLEGWTQYTISTYTTDANGYYYLSLPVGDYLVQLLFDGYEDFVQYISILDVNRVEEMQPATLISEGEEVQNGTIRGTLSNATNNIPLSGVTIEIRNNWNNTTGTMTVAPLATDTNGRYEVTLPYGYYTFTAIKEGFITAIMNITILEAQSERNYFMNPKDDSEYRIVLTWNATPTDLDSHLFANNVHCFYGTPVFENCQLDIDVTTGYGPETVTVYDLEELGDFSYGIHNWSGDAPIWTSNAVVRLYKGENLIRTYYVPTVSGSEDNRVWNVFKMSKDGVITDVNTFSTYFESNSSRMVSALSLPDKGDSKPAA